jgi:hypothetical protein
MRHFLTILLLSLLPVSLMAQSSPDTVDFRLDAHQWEHRLLFLFVPGEAPDQLEIQEEAFADRDTGFRDRDLLLITLIGATDGTVRDAPGAQAQPLTGAAVERLYNRFSVPADSFRVILVGKDGTEKRRNAEPVTARSIFDTIDAMPMRQREMREDSDGE